ncbi:pentapeptide MXKDX repeat protein [Paraburkholderia sp. MMS20-SJTN17]|uniref:Pentapeptide MXKDX repeat protein n=1 Tax=Paraburkholderia translucens TaxID=2886945 RepID=A0ABS8KKS5_9BURK|nr:pentapeptide MXKDX repeat protein [Paraburkholderia sp. MMS20-SJTN17]MCC8405364.1 pentapeptide MXKDX repeat protein [Paraburkholderia sp. MMS20-SJTN17]
MKKIAVTTIALLMLAGTGTAFAQASGSMSNDAMSKDAMSKDAMSKDSMSKDSMKKDSTKHDSMKKGGDAMKHEASGAMGN